MKNNLFLLFGLLPLFFGTQALQAFVPLSQARYSAKRAAKLVPDDTTGAIFFDDFSKGLERHWIGGTYSFTILDKRLRLSSQATVPAAIAIPSTRAYNTVWEAGVQIDGSLSASNYVRLYLMSSNASLLGTQQGYHLQIDGANGGYAYRLWRQNGDTRSLIFESASRPNHDKRFRARVRIVRSNEGRWEVFADEYDSGTFAKVASKDGAPNVLDARYSTGGYAGYLVNCPPSRRADYTLDYLLISVFDLAVDSLPPDGVGPNDMLINEILSHPKPGGVDFVELYNYSNKAIDLQQIAIASVSAGGSVGKQRAVSDRPLMLYPQEYKVLTTDPRAVKRDYPDAHFDALIETPDLPNFNNENGGVVLYSDGVTIDSLFYTPAAQSPFIVDHGGVSLERQDFSMPTNAPGNFRSAATSVGGATPGFPNSIRKIEGDTDGFSLTSRTFSPDNDGFEDQLEINYRLGADGFMVNVDIYNDKGLLVKRLLRNQRLAATGSITWDGLSDAQQQPHPGMYIAVIELYNTNGIAEIYRKGFVLAARQ